MWPCLQTRGPSSLSGGPKGAQACPAPRLVPQWPEPTAALSQSSTAVPPALAALLVPITHSQAPSRLRCRHGAPKVSLALLVIPPRRPLSLEWTPRGWGGLPCSGPVSQSAQTQSCPVHLAALKTTAAVWAGLRDIHPAPMNSARIPPQRVGGTQSMALTHTCPAHHMAATLPDLQGGLGERKGRLSLPRGLGPKQGHDLGVGPLTSGASPAQHLLGTRASWRVSRAQLDPPVSLAPGSKPFPVHRISACLDQGGEVPATLTTPRDRLVTVPPGTRGQASSQTAHLLSSGSERSCRGRGGAEGVSWAASQGAAVATLRPAAARTLQRATSCPWACWDPHHPLSRGDRDPALRRQGWDKGWRWSG